MNAKTDDFAAVHRQLYRWANPARRTRQRIWTVDGIGHMNDGCGSVSLGCCDISAMLEANGYRSGMSGVSSSMVDAVTSTLKLIPGGSSLIATAETVNTIYDIITNQAANRLNAEVEEYAKRVSTMNEALPKIYTVEDQAKRAELLARYQRTAASMTSYGSALIDKMNKYNELARKISSLSYENVNPPTVTPSGMPVLSVPNLSGLGAIQIPLAIIGGTIAVACIAAVLYHYADVIQTYMQYDLKVRGIAGELNTEYQGLTGMVQKFIDKTGGSILSTVLLVGAGVVAFLFLKNYMSRKNVIGPAPVKAAVKELETVAELSSIAQGA